MRISRWLLAGDGDERSADADDSAYHRCSPTVNEALERYLIDHESEFLELE